MKCKTFIGNEGEAVVAFNKWAKGKVLTRDIIIHTNTHCLCDKSFYIKLSITVYFPEGSAWDKEELLVSIPSNTKIVIPTKVETEAITT